MFFDKIDFAQKKYYNDNLVKECEKKLKAFVSLICLSFTYETLVCLMDRKNKGFDELL